MRALALLGIAILLLFTATGSQAATQMDTFACRNGIVSRGDVQAEVLAKCGPPSFAAQRDEAVPDRAVRFVTVEEWTYNRGPNEFMYLVRFVNGRVARLESLDYGY